MYFWLLLKRELKMLPSLFLSIFVLGGACVFLVFFNYGRDALEEQKTKFKLGIVGEMESSYLDFGIKAIETLDDSKIMLELKNMSLEDAKESLREGKINAYMIIPEEFIYSLVYGTNDSRITIVSSEGQMGITNIFMKEVAEIASKIIVASEKPLFSFYDVCADKGFSGDVYGKEEELNILYIFQVLDRCDFCKVETTGVGNKVSTITYFIFAAITVFCCFLGVVLVPVFVKKDNSFEKLLASRGRSIYNQALTEFLAFFCIEFLCFIIFSAIMLLVYSNTSMATKEAADTFELFKLLIYFVPCIFIFTAVHMLLTSISSSFITGAIAQFGTFLVLCLCGGAFLPISYIPKGIAFIGKRLPVGVSMNFVTSMASGKGRLSATIMLLLTFICLYLLILIVKNMRIWGEEK